MTSLDDQIAALATMSPAELRALWREQYRSLAPDIGPDLLRRGIAWRMQARVHGGLPVQSRSGEGLRGRVVEEQGR